MLEAGTDRYRACIAATDADIRRSQRLRWRCFMAGQPGAAADGRDQDRFDATCQHVLIEDRGSGRLLACFRVQVLNGPDITRGYAGSHYDLTGLRSYDGVTLEIGRFCIDPQVRDAAILRLAWVMLAQMVDRHGVRLLFGCASFPGADAQRHRHALALLGRDHLAPRGWQPGIRAADVFCYGRDLRGWRFDPRLAQAGLPPLLRSYLRLGARVGDHAVIDRQLDTLHVLTLLEVQAIPAARLQLLRAARPGRARLRTGS